MNQKAPVIEVMDLVTHYGSRLILKGVSLDVHEGEIMVVMGGSGSGKSTLLRHLLGLENATSGSIKLLGKELGEASSMELYELRKKMGVAFQGGALFSSMTVGGKHHLAVARAYRSRRVDHEHHGQTQARGGGPGGI